MPDITCKCIQIDKQRVILGVKTNHFGLKWTGSEVTDMITDEGPRPKAKRSDM